jgi:hypothetical protein
MALALVAVRAVQLVLVPVLVAMAAAMTLTARLVEILAVVSVCLFFSFSFPHSVFLRYQGILGSMGRWANVTVMTTGADDTYGSAGATGGAATGRDDDYGMGAGRTGGQDQGGFGAGGYDDDNNNNKSGGKDSTAGKLMEKAGDMFKNPKLKERGAEKREQAGGYGGDDNTGTY